LELRILKELWARIAELRILKNLALRMKKEKKALARRSGAEHAKKPTEGDFLRGQTRESIAGRWKLLKGYAWNGGKEGLNVAN